MTRRRMTAAALSLTAALSLSCGRPPDPAAGLLNRLKSVSRLATVRFTFNKIIWGEKEKRLFLKLNNASFMAYSKVEVTAGIDLAKVQARDVEVSGRSVLVRLPPVEIVAYSYPFEKVEVDRNYTASRFLNPIRLEDMEEFLRLADADVRRSLAGLGLRRRAEDNTRVLLVRALEKFGFETVDLVFAEAGPLAFTAYE